MPRTFSVQPMRQTLGWLWALPLTAYALPLCLMAMLEKYIFKKKQANVSVIWSQCAMVIVVYSPWTKAILMRHPMGAMQAAALGCCILAQDAQALQRCWAHERVHVAQTMRWGIFFPLAYILAGMWAKSRSEGRSIGRASGHATERANCYYLDNPFEREAESVSAQSEYLK